MIIKINNNNSNNQNMNIKTIMISNMAARYSKTLCHQNLHITNIQHSSKTFVIRQLEAILFHE